MRWRHFEIIVPDYASEIISSLMHELFEGIAITPLQGCMAHHAYVSTEEDIAQTERELKEILNAIPRATLPPESLQINTDWVEENDWAEAWKQHYRPIRIGRGIVIVPTWRPWPDPHSSLEAREDDIVIRLDPGMAFGTGTHSSTSMSIRALEDHLQEGDRVIDVGCGSGILSIAACKLGAQRVLAIDNDPVCIKISADNTVSNEVADKCSIRHLDTPAPIEGTFDVYVSNITEPVICCHMPDAVRILEDDGIYICSGFTHRSVETIGDKMDEVGLERVEEYAEGEWRCWVARKQ